MINYDFSTQTALSSVMGLVIDEWLIGFITQAGNKYLVIRFNGYIYVSFIFHRFNRLSIHKL